MRVENCFLYTIPNQHITKSTHRELQIKTEHLQYSCKKPQIFAEQLDRILSNKMKYCLRYGFPCELRQNSVIP